MTFTDVLITALVIAVALGATYLEHRNRFLQSRVGWKGDGHLAKHDTSNRNHKHNLERLRALDTHFVWDRFEARFKSAFLKIQTAWQHHQLESIRHFVSDGIYERFALQIKEQQDRGYRDHMEAINVHRLRLAEFHEGDVFDTLTIQVDASAIDYRVSLENDRPVSGKKPSQNFTEFWSFVRRRGVVTREASGLLEGECPNCTAPIQLTQHGQCGTCQALVRSGEYDWVLAEITQACEWRPQTPQTDALLNSIRHRDPALCVQHLEDRASVIFWRLVMSERLGSTKPLQKVATDDYVNWLKQSRLTPDENGRRRAYVDCAVGAVDLIGVVSDAERDTVVMRMKWSGNSALIQDQTGEEHAQRWARRQSLFILTRSRSAQTPLQRAFDSAHCPCCGGAETDLTSHACEFCGTTLNTGEHDWVLAGNHLHASPEAQDWMKRIQGPACSTLPTPAAPGDASISTMSELDLLAGMIVVLAADGEVEESELNQARSFAKKNGVPEPMVDGLIQSALRGDLDANTPNDTETGRAWLAALADMALSDGRIDDQERATLEQIGAPLGFVHADIELILGKRRAELRKSLDA